MELWGPRFPLGRVLPSLVLGRFAQFALRHANDIGIVIHYDRAGAVVPWSSATIYFFSVMFNCPESYYSEAFCSEGVVVSFSSTHRYRKANGDQSVCDRQMHLHRANDRAKKRHQEVRNVSAAVKATLPQPASQAKTFGPKSRLGSWQSPSMGP